MQNCFAAPGVAEVTAIRNGTLQGAYLIVSARALELDRGPMSGFQQCWRGQSLVSRHANPTRLFSDVMDRKGQVFSFVPTEKADSKTDQVGQMRALAKERGRFFVMKTSF
jgi:hypothetical protein